MCIRDRSYADAKADRNAPRLPPVLPADGDAFLTTYAIGQEMFFGSRNTHVCGLNDVRGKLKMLGSNQFLPKLLYPNTIWSVTTDANIHFNQVLLPSDFDLGSPTSTIRWPSTDLHGYTQSICGQSFSVMWSMPSEWINAITTNAYYGSASGYGASGGSAHLFCDELPNGHGAKLGKYLEDGLG